MVEDRPTPEASPGRSLDGLDGQRDGTPAATGRLGSQEVSSRPKPSERLDDDLDSCGRYRGFMLFYMSFSSCVPKNLVCFK